MRNKTPKTIEEKEICAICRYGDGKWEERQGQKMPIIQNVCKKCKNDGWTIEPQEVIDALKKDPSVSLFYKSPF